MLHGVLLFMLFLSSICAHLFTIWHARADILNGQLVAAQDPDFSIKSLGQGIITSLGVKKSHVNPSQLLSLGGVWRLSTLPAGHEV